MQEIQYFKQWYENNGKWKKKQLYILYLKLKYEISDIHKIKERK